MKKKFLIVIGGPTAVGKTAMAIRLAQYFKTEIISADSRQFYKGLNIGTAKPSTSEMAEVKHHFIDFLDLNQEYSIGDFEKDGLNFLEDFFETNHFAILVGGSGMYIRALCEGLDFFPEVDERTKEAIEKIHEIEGLAALQRKLQSLDSETFANIDINNPSRLKRALGVCMSSEKPFSYYKNQEKRERNFIPIYIALDEERESLYQKINERVDEMLKKGLEKEVKEVLPYKEKNALQTVGYQEFIEYFENKISRERAIELVKQHTRNYAKRQLTWFRNQSNYNFFSAKNDKEIIKFIEKQTEI